MRAIDRKKNHSESLKFLESVKELDPDRSGYYTDLSNKWSIEDRLADWIVELDSNRDTPLDLSNLNLTDLHYKPYLCVADQITLHSNCFEKKRIDVISTLLTNSNVKFSLDETNKN